MKKIFFICIISTVIIFGQADTLDILRYYPLQIGNKWQYEKYNFDDEFDGNFTVEITGDTIMPNGKRYFMFSPYLDLYERIDTNCLSVNVYDTYDNKDIIKFPLNISELDTVPLYLGILEQYNVGIGEVGKITVTKPYKYFKYENGTYIEYYTLSKDVGLSTLTMGVFEHTRYYESNRYLISAIIGDSIYRNFNEIGPESIIFNSYKLYQNFPNPFNPTTIVKFCVFQRSNVNINTYDMNGKLVSVLFSGIKNAGEYSLTWDANNFSSGIYFIEMVSGKFRSAKKCLLIK